MYYPFRVKAQRLCNSNFDLQLEMRFINRSDFQNIQIAHCHASMNEILAKKTFPLKNSQGRPAGTLIFDEVSYVERPSYIDYLKSGW